MSDSPYAAPGPRDTAESAREATQQVSETARQQAQSVLGEAKGQARQAATRMQHQVTSEANTQTRRLSENIKAWSDEFASMAESAKPDSPAQGLVQQIATGGRQAATYLDEQGIDGLLADVRSFARRRPGAFLASAALAGFAIARLAKASAGTSRDEPSYGQGMPAQRHFGQTPGSQPTYQVPQSPPTGPGLEDRAGREGV